MPDPVFSCQRDARLIIADRALRGEAVDQQGLRRFPLPAGGNAVAGERRVLEMEFDLGDPPPGGEFRRHVGGEGRIPGISIGAAGFSPQDTAIISTFTSAQEREALHRALVKGRKVIQVCPSGVPGEAPAEAGLPDIEEAGFSPRLLEACREGRALILSPQPPGSRLNKKVATWCNEYVLRHASEVWVGDIAPGGLLDTLLEESSRV